MEVVSSLRAMNRVRVLEVFDDDTDKSILSLLAGHSEKRGRAFSTTGLDAASAGRASLDEPKPSHDDSPPPDDIFPRLERLVVTLPASDKITAEILEPFEAIVEARCGSRQRSEAGEAAAGLQEIWFKGYDEYEKSEGAVGPSFSPPDEGKGEKLTGDCGEDGEKPDKIEHPEGIERALTEPIAGDLGDDSKGSKSWRALEQLPEFQKLQALGVRCVHPDIPSICLQLGAWYE